MEAEKIHWRVAAEKECNAYAINPSPEMLRPEGLLVLRSFGKRGRRGSYQVERRYYTVLYDESYVVTWLSRKVLRSLSGIPYNQLQKLFSEAMRQERENIKQEGKKQDA